MKRILILIVLLAAILGGQGLEEKKQEQACVCKEGEKNCPCLAQSQGKGKLENTALVNKEVKAEDKPKAKIQAKATVKAKISVKVPEFHITKKELLKKLASKVKLKKIAPMEKSNIRKYKVELKTVKSKLKALKSKIGRAAVAKKKKLIFEKQVFKKKCVDLKKAINETKAKLAAMEKSFSEECQKQAAIKEAKCTNILKELLPKINEIKAKIKEMKEMLGVAPKKDKPFIKRKIKALEKTLKGYTDKQNKAKGFIEKLHEAKQKGEEEKLKKQQKLLEVSIEKKGKKLMKLKTIKKKLLLKLTTLEKKVKAIRLTLQSKNIKSKDEKAKKVELEKLLNAAKLVKAKLDKAGQNELQLKKEQKEAALKIEEIKRVLKETKEKEECLKMKKKLADELLIMKTLRVKFQKECVKAIKTQKKKHIAKVLSIKEQINAVKLKIDNLKKIIKNAPRNQRKKLANKIKELQKILMVKMKLLQKREVKLAKIQKKMEVKSTKKLVQKKVELIAKVAATKKEIIDYKKLTKLLKLKHKKACQDALIREKEKSRESIAEIKRKLEFGQKHAESLEKALKFSNKISDLSAKVESFRQQALEATDPQLKSELQKQETNLKNQLTKAKKGLQDEKSKAKALQHELDQKTMRQIEKEKKLNDKAEIEVEKLMKASLAKEESLQKELKKAGDKEVKDALQKELDIEKKKLKNLNIKLREIHQDQTALAHEMDLQEKEAIQRLREEELREAMMAKNMKNLETQLRYTLTTKFTKNKNDQVAAQTALNEKELAEHQKRLKMAQAETTTTKVAIKAAGKKKLLDILGNIKKTNEEILAKLEKELKEEKLNGQMLKLVLEKEHSEKLQKLDKRLLAESRAKQLNMKKEIQKEIARGEAAIKAAQMKSKAEIEHEKKNAKKKIKIMEKEIEKIKKSSMKEKLALNKDILNAETHTSELTTSLELEKKQNKQLDKEMTDWTKQEDKIFKAKAKKIKDAETAANKKITKDITSEKAKVKKGESDLEARLKAAKAEVAKNKADLVKESANYKKLQTEMETYITTQTKKNQAEIDKAMAKRKADEKVMKDKLAKCEKSIKDEQKSLKTLQTDFEAKMNQIKALNNIEEKRAAARDTLNDYETNLLALTAKSLDIVSQINDTCQDESSDDVAATCNKLRKDQENTKADIITAKQKVADSRDIYLKL